ncbi:MAG: hypothetical protein ACRCWW_01935 [Scandinavium sp.]|uniref:hypothetical protein n=1 Tax=Scandinavium sp. TaxID=2830653 RepID=UPI003F3AAEE7
MNNISATDRHRDNSSHFFSLLFYKKSLILISVIFMLFTPKSFSALIITSVRTDVAYLGNDPLLGYFQAIGYYIYTWQKVSGPEDNNPVPAGYLYYGPVAQDRDIYVSQSSPYKPQGGPLPDYILYVRIYPGDKWKDVEERWLLSAGGATSSYASLPFPPRTEPVITACMKFIAAEVELAAGMQYSSATTNGSPPCVGAPPLESPKCNITNDINLNFGTLNSGSEAGAEATTTATINCDLNATLKMYDATGQNGVVDLGGGLKAKTLIDGVELPVSGKQVSKGSTTLTVSAKIEGQDAPPGDYSGSYPLIIEYQ